MAFEAVSLFQEAMKLQLDRILKQRGMKQNQFAEAIGTSDSYVSQLAHGHRQPSPKLLARMGEVLDVHPSALIAPQRPISVAGRVGAGAVVELVDAYAKGDGLYHIACPDDLPAHGIVAVEVVGESMQPLIREGDVLLFTRHFLGVDASALGQVCILATADGRALVKDLRAGRDPGTFDLFSLNTAANHPEYGVRLKWAAPYRRHLRREDVERL